MPLDYLPMPAMEGRQVFAGRRVTWARALMGSALAVMTLAVLAFGAVSAVGLYLYATHDRIELFDLPEVSQRVHRARVTMSEQVARAASDTAPPAATIRRQNLAITAFVADVRSLGEEILRKDHPTLVYLRDWEAISDARERYAADLESGVAPAHFVMPLTTEGYPVTDRMEWRRRVRRSRH